MKIKNKIIMKVIDADTKVNEKDITISGAKEVSRDFGFSSFLGYIDVRGRLRGFDFIGRLSPRCRKQSYVRVHRPHGSNRPKTLISIGHVTNSVFWP